MNDCLFCKIVKGDIPSDKVFENEFVLGFKDISPLAKQHLLFINKKHTTNLNELMTKDPEQLLNLFIAINEFTKKEGLDNDGYRVVTNIGAKAGQTVFHTHVHVLGGEQLRGFGA